LLRAEPALGGGGLELPRFAWLHIVTATTEVLQDTRALHLFLEDPQCRFDTVAFAKLHFDHSRRLHNEVKKKGPRDSKPLCRRLFAAENYKRHRGNQLDRTRARGRRVADSRRVPLTELTTDLARSADFQAFRPFLPSRRQVQLFSSPASGRNTVSRTTLAVWVTATVGTPFTYSWAPFAPTVPFHSTISKRPCDTVSARVRSHEIVSATGPSCTMQRPGERRTSAFSPFSSS